MFDSFNHPKNMLPPLIDTAGKPIHSNACGMNMKLSDKQDTNYLVRHAFTSVEDKCSNVLLKNVKREYIFNKNIKLSDRAVCLSEFNDYLRSFLLFKQLSFIVYPHRTFARDFDTVRDFYNSKATFACICWDYVNVKFYFKTAYEFDTVYDLCKYYPLDEFSLITKANVNLDEPLIIK